MATTDIGRVTPIWRGFYSAATTYELNDLVIDNSGSVWWHKSEDQTTGVAPVAGEIWDAVIDMSEFSGLIQAAITTAQTALAAAQAALADVATDMERAETAAQNAENSATAASESAAGVGALAQAAAASAAAAEASETSASGSATSAAGSAEEAEAWATGGSGGTATATNNAKYYSEQSSASATSAASSASAAQDVLDSIPEDYSQLSEDVSDLKTQLNQRGIPAGGSTSQSLRKKSGTNYDMEWADVGLPTDEQTADAVSAWLDDHPEATTTVQDDSLTEDKFTNTLKLKTIKDYVTPEMFGATGDGTTDDSTAVRNALKYSIDNNIKLIIAKKYRVHGSILTPNDYNTARLNIEGLKAIQTSEYRISNAATCGISFDDGADLFDGLTLSGSISRVSFTPQSRTQTGSIFKNCTLAGFVFNECTVSDVGAICHNTNAKYLSKFQNSYFLSIKYFAKCDGVASFYECTDSQIRNNYINGDGSPESHCFEWTDYIHSSLLQNFIDYFQTIFYPVCEENNKAFIGPSCIGNDYQVFRYLYYRTNNIGTIFFNSNSDRFAETDADSMPSGQYAATKTKMENYAVYKSKIYGAGNTPHAGETIEDDLLPYIMYIDDRCQVSIQNAIISLYTRNLIYIGTSITVNQWSKAELTINKYYHETGNSYDNCVQECSIGFWNGGAYKQNTINIPFIKNYETAPTTANFAYFECYLGEKIKVGNTVSRFYAKNMQTYLSPTWYDITALV